MEGEFKMTFQTTASSTSASPLPAIGAVDRRKSALVGIDPWVTGPKPGPAAATN